MIQQTLLGSLKILQRIPVSYFKIGMVLINLSYYPLYALYWTGSTLSLTPSGTWVRLFYFYDSFCLPLISPLPLHFTSIIFVIFCCLTYICANGYIFLLSLFLFLCVVYFCWGSLVPLTHAVIFCRLHLFIVDAACFIYSCSWYFWIISIPPLSVFYFLMYHLTWLLTLELPTLYL